MTETQQFLEELDEPMKAIIIKCRNQCLAAMAVAIEEILSLDPKHPDCRLNEMLSYLGMVAQQNIRGVQKLHLLTHTMEQLMGAENIPPDTHMLLTNQVRDAISRVLNGGEAIDPAEISKLTQLLGGDSLNL